MNVELSEGLAIALEAKQAGRRRFSMLAYTGAVFEHPLLGPAVIDVSGIRVPTGGVPSYRQHDPNVFVGRCEKVTLADGRVRAEGFLFTGVAAADEVARISDAGGAWQASIRVEPVEPVDDSIERAYAGKTVSVNGATLSGPIAVMRKTELKEISWCPRGRDTATTAVALAEGAGAAAVKNTAAELAAVLAAYDETLPTHWTPAFKIAEQNRRAAVEREAGAFERRLVALRKQGHDHHAAVNLAAEESPMGRAAYVARANPQDQWPGIFRELGGYRG